MQKQNGNRSMLENFMEYSKPPCKLAQSLTSGPNLSATYGFTLIDHGISIMETITKLHYFVCIKSSENYYKEHTNETYFGTVASTVHSSFQ